MIDERTCVFCKHLSKQANEYPCINCTHNATDNFEKDTGGWIPVSERLPEEADIYLISYYRHYDGYVIQISPFNPEQDFDVEFWKDEIDAWMPLPEPYKESED